MLINVIDLKKLEQHFQREHVSRFGNGDETHTRTLVAQHEAGHAAIYALIGEFKNVCISKDKGYCWGRTGDSSVTVEIDPSVEIILSDILLFMSGYLAEKLCAKNYSESSSGVDKSYAKARVAVIAKQLDFDQISLNEELEHIVIDLLKLHKASLLRLSKRLKEAKSLSESATKHILGIEQKFDGYFGLGEYVLSKLNFKKTKKPFQAHSL